MTTPPEPAPLSVDEFRTLTLGAMSRDQLYRVISAAEAERDALRVAVRHVIGVLHDDETPSGVLLQFPMDVIEWAGKRLRAALGEQGGQ